MPKQPFQDVLPGRRSIRDVPVPRRRELPPSPINEVEPISPPPPPPQYPFDYDADTVRGSRRKWPWILGAVFVLVAAIGLLSFFASAKVVVTPKTQVVPASFTLTASLNEPSGVFGYQIISVSASTTVSVSAGTSTQVSTKATGVITAYNTMAKQENLVANTRFETSSGLVFRAVKAFSIPPASTANGKTTPGSVQVEVTADQSGNSYNIGPSAFTLPGLAGTSESSQIYGQSQSSMTQGFSGTQKGVNPGQLASSTSEMETALQSQLQSAIAAQIPANFIFYPSAVSYNFASPSQVPSNDQNSATLVLSGTASAPIFDASLLSQAIVTALNSQLSSGPQNAPAQITNLSALTFALVQPTSVSQNYTGNITFQISGDADVSWIFDEGALKSDLVGLKKANLNALLEAKYPSIQSASASIFPLWKGTFPANPAKITVTEVSGS